MSILTGGLFSNPSGKMGGVVFGAARTRTGKKVTSRLLVPPSNPNTAAQQIQRGKFAEALAIVRLIGSTFYQSDWNRAIGQLPGFQSMTSVYLNALDASEDIGVIPSINLGSLHTPDTFVGIPGGSSGDIDFTWSGELGLNGTNEDEVILLATAVGAGASPLERIVVTDATQTRDSLEVTIGGLGSGTPCVILLYCRGAGTADGLLCPTFYLAASAAA